jgi:nucleotide-binding universal stress UspA family protein
LTVYRKILVPLDGSGRAENILRHVEGLALSLRSKVVFLQVVRPVIVMEGYKTISAEGSRRQSHRALDEALKYLAGIEGEFREKGIETETISEIGPVVSTIISIAQRENVDLIAMASHGRGGVSRAFYGSVSSGVLNQVDRPLLLIRSRREP